jgi:hypothetical protein
MAADLGVNFTIAARLTVEDGINAVRMLIPKMWFDKTRCEQGLNALVNYRRDWNAKTDDWRDKPLHDWSSHGSDALRYFAISTMMLSAKEFKTEERYRRRQNRGGASWMSM